MQNLEVLLDFTRVEYVVNLGDIERRVSKIHAAMIGVVVEHVRVRGHVAKIDEESFVADGQAEVAIARREREVNRSEKADMIIRSIEVKGGKSRDRPFTNSTETSVSSTRPVH